MRSYFDLRSLGDSNDEILMAWSFQDIPISGAQEACAEVLTTTGVPDFCGA